MWICSKGTLGCRGDEAGRFWLGAYLRQPRSQVHESGVSSRLLLTRYNSNETPKEIKRWAGLCAVVSTAGAVVWEQPIRSYC